MPKSGHPQFKTEPFPVQLKEMSHSFGIVSCAFGNHHDGVGLAVVISGAQIGGYDLSPLIDLQARLVTRAGQPVHMTPTEYRLLAVLAANAGRVVTNPQLLREVWGPSNTENGHYLRIFMGRLRQKLEEDPARPKYLFTETAVGYRLLITPELRE